MTMFRLITRFPKQPAFRNVRFVGSRRSYSAEEISSMSIDDWATAFHKETIEVAKMDIQNVTYDESAERFIKIWFAST